MAVRKIILVPDPVLRMRAAPVRNFESATRSATDLKDTLYSNPGCVGIAAPQIRRLERMIAVDASRKKGVKSRGLLILCNPVIVRSEGRKIGREGCLSLPDYTANVTRFVKIVVRARGIDGRGMEVAASGFEAVVLQHEIDHLDGILFIDRVSNIKTDVFRRKIYK